jgi:hypothetical protein
MGGVEEYRIGFTLGTEERGTGYEAYEELGFSSTKIDEKKKMEDEGVKD